MTISAKTSPASARQRGRPREFDMDKALDKAVRIFSERGYHGTSITDLTRAMNLAQGSIYKAFGDKQGVFLAAFQRYRSLRTEQLRQVIGNNGTGYEKLRRALGFYVQSSHGKTGLLGCLVVGSVAELSTFEPAVAQHIVSALERNETFLYELICQGRRDGSISAQVNPRASARMLLCLVQGMRVVGKTGQTQRDMQSAVNMALKAIA